MRLGLCFFKVEDRAADDDRFAVVDEVVQHLQQREDARFLVKDGEHDDAERRLHIGRFEQVVEDDLAHGVALEFDDDADPFAVGFVADLADAVDLLVLDEIGDAFDQAGLVDHVGELVDDDDLFFAGLFDMGFGAYLDAAAAGFISVDDPFFAENGSARREVRRLDVVHDVGQRRLGIVDEVDQRGDDFTGVVRGNVGRHTDGDTGRAVDQQVRHTRRQNLGLLRRRVVVVDHVDGIFVQVHQEFAGIFGHTRFGITHRCRVVTVDGTEVPLAVDQRHAHGEGLGHPYQCVVDRRVAVRVVLTDDVPDDTGGFFVFRARREVEFVHGVKDAPVDRLEAVAHVRQCPSDDDAHGVVEVAALQRLFYIDILDFAVIHSIAHTLVPLPPGLQNPAARRDF